MTEYVDENWTNELLSSLLRHSGLNWSIEYDLQYQFKGRLEWRGDKHIKLYHMWEIKSKFGEFELFLTFDESLGAKKVRKGMLPFLALLHNNKKIFSTHVGRKGHKKVDAKALIPNSAWCDYAPQYNLKPHIDDLVDTIIEVISKHDTLNSVYMVDGEIMTGQEVIDSYGRRGSEALFDTMKDDVGIIDNRITVELLGSPKKASIQRVASTYLRSLNLPR